ncbi:dihydroxy-acid dehydratase [Actinomadura sp.]|uniref:dihydroxy-acid dehydratase domain-containing protein n=2 Tax=Actinomadura sp. TaxID=1989 RepID=UPI0037C98168
MGRGALPQLYDRRPSGSRVKCADPGPPAGARSACARHAGRDQLRIRRRSGRRICSDQLLRSRPSHGTAEQPVTYVSGTEYRAGGVPAVMRALLEAGHLHGEAMTVTGWTVAENLADAPPADRRSSPRRRCRRAARRAPRHDQEPVRVRGHEEGPMKPTAVLVNTARGAHRGGRGASPGAHRGTDRRCGASPPKRPCGS